MCHSWLQILYFFSGLLKKLSDCVIQNIQIRQLYQHLKQGWQPENIISMFKHCIFAERKNYNLKWKRKNQAKKIW